MRLPDDVREQDIKQVWFAGSHADVGGGYPEQESGLSISVALDDRRSRQLGLLVHLQSSSV